MFNKHLSIQNNTPEIHSAQTRTQNTDVIRATSMQDGRAHHLAAKELKSLTLISFPQAKHTN